MLISWGCSVRDRRCSIKRQQIAALYRRTISRRTAAMASTTTARDWARHPDRQPPASISSTFPPAVWPAPCHTAGTLLNPSGATPRYVDAQQAASVSTTLSEREGPSRSSERGSCVPRSSRASRCPFLAPFLVPALVASSLPCFQIAYGETGSHPY